jgi:hypothetical protein
MDKNGSSFNEWTRNHVWFRAHYQRLSRSYDGQNVCVYKRRVVDHDRDLRSLMRRVRGRYPQEEVLVEFVSRKKLEFILPNLVARSLTVPVQNRATATALFNSQSPGRIASDVS